MTDVFNNQDPVKSEDVLSELVGDGKKFKTVQDLAKGKKESDGFIEQLKAEQAALRAQLAELTVKQQESATLKTVLDKLNETKANSKGAEGNQPNLNPEELKKLVEATVTERETLTTKERNRSLANELVLKQFQDPQKASEYVEAKARELGLPKKQLETLAESSPQAFATLLGLSSVDVSTNTRTALSSLRSVNTEALNTNSSNRDETFFKDLRVKDSKTFWSPRVQQELFRYGQTHGIEAVQRVLNNK